MRQNAENVNCDPLFAPITDGGDRFLIVSSFPGVACRRFTIRQDTTETESECVLGSTTWTARSAFDNFRDTVSVDVRGTAFDLVIATTQEGSVVDGSLTFENDAVREGPFTIEDGRMTGGRATLSVRPTEHESIDFVRTLGTALPIGAQLTVVGGTEARISVEQPCSCEDGQFTASRIRIGL